jgi:formate dehydrogenase subunit delta
MTYAIPPEARLGNDIVRQFGHLPREVAVAKIADHIERFWDPRMRRHLKELVTIEDESLDPLLVAAAAAL